MSSEPKPPLDLFNGLKTLSDASFPKKCALCGEEYDTVEAYIQKTGDVAGKSGLKKGFDDDDKPIVELFRNCICGSTLMDFFNDRRDITKEGLRRRKRFGQLMRMLIEKEIERAVARSELLKIIKGEHSPVLEKMGIHTLIR